MGTTTAIVTAKAKAAATVAYTDVHHNNILWLHVKA